MTRPPVLVLAAAAAAVSIAFSASAAVRHPAAPAGRIFRGNGDKVALSPFSVGAPSTLYWSNNGPLFQVFPAGEHGGVNSQGAKGWTYLPRGRYALRIRAVGSWVIKVVPGIVHPRHRGGWLTYSGNGAAELPPFHASHGQQLRWRAGGGVFQIFSSDFGGVRVNSRAKRGSAHMAAGAQQLRINATGAWTISWRP